MHVVRVAQAVEQALAEGPVRLARAVEELVGDSKENRSVEAQADTDGDHGEQGKGGCRGGAHDKEAHVDQAKGPEDPPVAVVLLRSLCGLLAAAVSADQNVQNRENDEEVDHWKQGQGRLQYALPHELVRGVHRQLEEDAGDLLQEQAELGEEGELGPDPRRSRGDQARHVESHALEVREGEVAVEQRNEGQLRQEHGPGVADGPGELLDPVPDLAELAHLVELPGRGHRPAPRGRRPPPKARLGLRQRRRAASPGDSRGARGATRDSAPPVALREGARARPQ